MATTKENIRTKVTDILDDRFKEMKKDLEELLDSGMLDLESEDDNFELPKLIVMALARRMERSIAPPQGYPQRRVKMKKVDNIDYMLDLCKMK